MASIFTEIKKRFDTGSVLEKFIFINVGVFIIIRLLHVIMSLFVKEPFFLEYIEIPSSIAALAYKPWTLITYMFVHFDFLHILFNMLWLYWFGKIFLTFFTERQLGGLYILGGIAGAALFLLSYNTIPLLVKDSGHSLLAGASASVMAIVFAVSFYQKDYKINLLFIGSIKLIYLAIVVFLLDLFAITSNNAGGHIAHIGGSLFGILFAFQYNRGKDITGFINRIIDKFVNLTRKRPKFKIFRTEKKVSDNNTNNNRHRTETDDEYLRRKNEERRAIDEILDKLKRSGYESLSANEKKRLFDASKN